MNVNRPTEFGITLLMMSAAVAGARDQEKPSVSVQRPQRAELALDIPALPLGDALTEFGRQTGLHIVMNAQLGVGRSSRRVKGRYTPDAALHELLTNTGLSYEYLDDKTIVLDIAGAQRPATSIPAFVSESIRVAQANAAPGSSVDTAAADSTGKSEPIEEVVIRGVEFNYEEAQSVNKMPMSVKDAPQTVKVITQDLMDFAGIRRFDDIARLDASSGVTYSGDRFPRQYYRGFFSYNSVKVDGFRSTYELQPDLSTFERFELVKGSTSTLYGQNSVGGTLNAISKMPKSQPGGEVSLEAGSYSHYRGDVDFYGPMTEDSRLTYRMVGAYQRSKSYVEFSHDDRVVLAPTIKFSPSATTDITARASYQRYDFAPYFGFGAQFLGTDRSDPAQKIAENFRIPEVPRSRTGNSPTAHALKTTTIGQVLLDQHLGDWTLRGSAQYAHTGGDNAGLLVFGTDRNGFSDTLAYSRDFDQNTFSGEVNLFGDVEAFGRTHTLFFGADYATIRSKTTSGSGNYLVGASSGFSILNPDYSLLDLPTSASDYSSFYRYSDNHKMSGVTLQSLLRPIDGLTVSLGARYSHDVDTAGFASGLEDPLALGDPLKASAFTYQTGITYALTPRLNVYTSRGTTFEPQSGLVAVGKPIDPEEGIAEEIGLKGDSPSRTLSFSVALFRMRRTNISQSNPGTPFVLPIGTQQSKGVELELQGKLLPGWQIYGSVAGMNAEYVDGQFKGVQPGNAPKFGLSTFTSYEIQHGSWRGLGFGAGVVHKGGRHTNDITFGYGGNTPINFLRDFTEVDLRAFYTMRSWQLELSATNIFNELYYTNVRERLALGFQSNPPRQLMANVRYRF